MNESTTSIHTTVPLYTTELPAKELNLERVSKLIEDARWFEVVIASIREGENAYGAVSKADKVIEFYKERFTDSPVERVSDSKDDQ